MLNLVKIYVVLIILSALAVSMRPAEYVPDYPMIEDSFFVFTIADNIAQGNGISADGENLTNGFQPLYTIAVTPFFALSGNDKILPLRLVTAFNVLLFALTALLVGMISKDFIKRMMEIDEKIPFWLGIIIYLTSLLAFGTHLNGLETGMLMLFLALIVRLYQVLDFSSVTHTFIFGIVLGFTVLTRIDTVFLVILISFFLLFRIRGLPLMLRLQIFLLISGTAFLVSSPWWLYNYFVFGSIMPSSGKALQAAEFNFGHYQAGLYYLAQVFSPHFYTFEKILRGTPGFILKLIVALATIGFAIKNYAKTPYHLKSKRLCTKTIEIVFLLSANLVILFFWYVNNSDAVYFYLRYFSPYLIIPVLMLTFIFAGLYKKSKVFIIVLFTVFTILVIGASYMFFTKSGYSGSGFLHHQIELVRQYVPAGETVASGQTGTLGYFRDNVLNLDGKVNAEALKYRNNMPEYLEKKNVRWFCDWMMGVKFFLGDNPGRNGWVKVDSSGDFYLYENIEMTAKRK